MVTNYKHTEIIMNNDLYIGSQLKEEVDPRATGGILLEEDLLNLEEPIRDKRAERQFIYIIYGNENDEAWKKASNHNSLEAILWNDPYRIYHIKTKTTQPIIEIPAELLKNKFVLLQLRAYKHEEVKTSNVLYMHVTKEKKGRY